MALRTQGYIVIETHEQLKNNLVREKSELDAYNQLCECVSEIIFAFKLIDKSSEGEEKRNLLKSFVNYFSLVSRTTEHVRQLINGQYRFSLSSNPEAGEVLINIEHTTENHELVRQTKDEITKLSHAWAATFPFIRREENCLNKWVVASDNPDNHVLFVENMNRGLRKFVNDDYDLRNTCAIS